MQTHTSRSILHPVRLDLNLKKLRRNYCRTCLGLGFHPHFSDRAEKWHRTGEQHRTFRTKTGTETWIYKRQRHGVIAHVSSSRTSWLDPRTTPSVIDSKISEALCQEWEAGRLSLSRLYRSQQDTTRRRLLSVGTSVEALICRAPQSAVTLEELNGV